MNNIRHRTFLAVLGLLVSVLPIAAFWLSWGVTRSEGQIGFGFGTYTLEIQHTGKDAGPYGYLTLATAGLSFVLWVIAIWARKSRGVLGGQLLISLFGGVFVFSVTLSHPAIGWPLGPKLAIAGFIASALVAGISLLVPARQTISE
jgi:hypothetical protein